MRRALGVGFGLGFALGLVGVASSAAAAPAPEADPRATEAADANLEPTGRHGVVLSGSLLPGTIVGFGSRGDTGLGATVSLRLGKVASATTTMYVELVAGGIVHQPPGMGATTNGVAILYAGALHYVQPSLWLRLGLGWGSYSRNNEQVDGALVAHEALSGPAGDVGVGVDLVRWRAATLQIEAASGAVLHTGGMTTVAGLGLGLTF